MYVGEYMDKIVKRNIWLLVLVIFVIGLAPILSGVAFAQMYTDADNPSGPMTAYAWSAMAIVVGVISGAGIFTIFKKK
jgi:polyferredoxin